MRILHVARYGSVKGGAETYLAALCEQQRAEGHTVALAFGLDPDPDRPEVAAGYHLPALVDARASASAEDEQALAAVIDSFAPDVVHVHAADMAWVAPFAAARAPTLLAAHDHTLHCPAGTKYWPNLRRACGVRPGVKCLAFNVAGGCGSLRANATLRPYRRWKAANAAARSLPVQAFSEAMRILLARADVAQVTVTPYPVPPQPEPVMPDEPDDRPVVLAVGRLNREKGFDLLLRTLYDVGTNVHLVIAGHGHERDRLEKMAIRAPRGNRVTFTGWLSPARMAGWYQRAAVVAVPSAWVEPFGIVGLEAMAHGTPVVAFDTGGVREWLEDGVTGILVPPGDAAELGRAIGTLLQDETLRHQMGRTGTGRVAERFSLVGHSARLTTLYDAARRDRGQEA